MGVSKESISKFSLVAAPQSNSFSKQDWLECRLRVVRIPIYELPSLRCGFYEVFSDKTKIIFNGCAMIDVQKFNFACFLQQFEKLDVSVDGSDTYLEKVRKDCNELVVKLHAIGQWFLTFQPTRTLWAFVKFSRTPCLKPNNNWY